VNTLLFRPNGVQVAVVDGAGKALLRTVTLGRDFGTTVEVTSGLDVSERVIANPGDAIAPGDAVRVVENSPPAAESPRALRSRRNRVGLAHEHCWVPKSSENDHVCRT